jgi:hypothetical protein
VLQTTKTLIGSGRRSSNASVIFRKSSANEKILEYRLIANLAAELRSRGLDLAVLRDDIDCHGRDLLLECAGILRHVQLKAMAAGGGRREVTINLQLATRPSACVIWFDYDPATLQPASYRWFGGAPGQRLPSLGSRTARHTRGNREGEKQQRPGHRVLRGSRFDTLPTISDLADRLFGPVDGGAVERQRLLDYLIGQSVRHDADWLEDVRIGRFSSIPERLDDAQSYALADMIDGYELLGVSDVSEGASFLEVRLARALADGRWPGSATELWITLFLEHRRRYFADGFPHPYGELFSVLEQQLRAALIDLEDC